MLSYVMSGIAWGGGAAAAGAAVYAGLKGRRRARRLREEHERVRQGLAMGPSGRTFDPESVASLPGPAQRWLRRAIVPGTPLARTAAITTEGSMRPGPKGPRMRVRGDELLVPERGFAWKARVEAGHVRGEVLDHYLAGDGAVHVTLLGVVPAGDATGRDVTDSSLGRLVAESVWAPSSLLPRDGVRWEPVDDARARVQVTVDGVTLPITLTVAPDGRLERFSLPRHGHVGVHYWQPLPYGFTVDDEARFGGYTIPSKLRGGWWFDTHRFDPAAATKLVVRTAAYR